MNGEFVDSIRLFNVASYLHSADVVVDVPGIGELIVDIAFDGIRPSIGGWAQITGHNTILVDEKDSLRHGFQLA